MHIKWVQREQKKLSCSSVFNITFLSLVLLPFSLSCAFNNQEHYKLYIMDFFGTNESSQSVKEVTAVNNHLFSLHHNKVFKQKPKFKC